MFQVLRILVTHNLYQSFRYCLNLQKKKLGSGKYKKHEFKILYRNF